MKIKKQHIMIGVVMVLVVAAAAVGAAFFANDSKQVITIDIPDSEKIAKLVYNANGDVYEITDAQAVSSFVESINGMSFVRGDSLAHATWSPFIVTFVDENGVEVYSLQIWGEGTGIITGDDEKDGPYQYTAKDERTYESSILEDYGVRLGQ